MRRLTDKEYKFVFSRTPRLCVDLVIKSRSGILLSKRLIPPHQGRWHFPGGKVNYKESVNEAVRRIAKAELGVFVSHPKLLGFMEFPNDGDFVHSISLVFMVESKAKNLKGGTQAKELVFFQSLPKDMHPIHKHFAKQEELFG